MLRVLAVGVALVGLAACGGDPGAASSGGGGSGGASASSSSSSGVGGGQTSSSSASSSSGAGTGGAGTGGAGTGGAGGAGPEPETRGMWVWQKKVATDAVEEDKLFTFCAQRGVNTVFLESQSLIGASQPALATFIDHAAAKGIAVELLFGNMNWALPAGHATAVGLAQQSVAFASGLGAAAKPAGVHFDVEPYTLAEWSSDQGGTANSYLDLLDSLAQATAGSGLRLSADIAFWFDTVMVTRKGQTRPLSEWVIDAIDRAVLMDYRDTSSEIVKQSSTEIAYGVKTGRRLLIGVETLCNLSPAYITFCEEGLAVLTSELDAVHAQVGSSAAFAGFGIHDYVAYQALKP